MARKSKEDAQRTRERILASALTLFVRKGYENTTFNEIASRVKMTKGAVYWHFESKEELLLELVRMALDKFGRQIETRLPTGELTFLSVAAMMVENAVRTVSDPRASAFFKLMKCQIEWSDDKMSSVREALIEDVKKGPKQAFRDALANDVANGRAREIDIEEISTVVIALWDGIVQAKIDRFLKCDLQSTLEHAYRAIWEDIRIKS